MRTTVEIPDEQRAKLLQLAAQRGEKGFSRLVQEALDLYLEQIAARGKTVKEALSVLGKRPKNRFSRTDPPDGAQDGCSHPRSGLGNLG